MTVELMLGFAAGLIHIAAFIIYYWQIFSGSSKPNWTTWTLWVFISSLNCISYIAMSKDVIKGILPIASTFACVVVFFASSLKGKFSKLDPKDTIVLLLGISSLFLWWTYHSATYANLLLQVCILISFFPTLRGVRKNPENEKFLPWFVWSFAYILNIIIVFLRWKDQYQDFAYPVNCFFLHFFVGVFSLRKLDRKDIA